MWRELFLDWANRLDNSTLEYSIVDGHIRIRRGVPGAIKRCAIQQRAIQRSAIERWRGDRTAIEKGPRPLGPDLLRNYPDFADRSCSHVWRGADPFSGTRGNDAAGGNGSDDRHGRELRPHGDGLSLGWIGLHLRESRVQ